MKARWPEPTDEQPDMDTIESMVMDIEDVTATDGCYIEPDGVCEHGHPSWLLYLGVI